MQNNLASVKKILPVGLIVLILIISFFLLQKSTQEKVPEVPPGEQTASILDSLPPGTPSYSSYAELRLASGSAEQMVALRAGKQEGAFKWQATDPNAKGDDGGIVIKSPNGWWVRQFTYDANNPIEMDWFGLNDGTDITTLITNIASSYKPNFY